MAFVRVPGNEIPEGAEEHWLEGRGGVRLRALTAPSTNGPARGSIIVAPGRTEFIEKYFEVIRELQGRGFAVFCIDWRGQGLSGREVGNSLKGHFASFDDPVNDLATALRLLAGKLPHPHIALAHSMGGAIVLRALQTRRVELEAAVFSAPMWGIAGLGDLGKKYVAFMSSLGAGGNFAPGVEQKWKRENFKRNPRHQRQRAPCPRARPDRGRAGFSAGRPDHRLGQRRDRRDRRVRATQRPGAFALAGSGAERRAGIAGRQQDARCGHHASERCHACHHRRRQARNPDGDGRSPRAILGSLRRSRRPRRAAQRRRRLLSAIALGAGRVHS
ncbi:MAG: alpha/beta hydrolase, partial [Terricaulis sp.]